MSLSRRSATTRRCASTEPSGERFAAVTHFSTTGRSALALDSVVTIDSAAISEATRLPIIAFWCAALPPSRLPLRGVPRISVLRAQRQPALVEALVDVLQRGLAEVGDRQQVRGRAVDELGDRVDAATLEAVARALGEPELFDAVVELGARARRGADVAELEARGLLVQRGDQVEEASQRGARGGERLARRDRAVGLDLEDQLVEVRRLLDADRLDREGHAAHRREDRVERDRPEGARALVALRAHVALAPFDGHVEREVALRVEGGDAEIAVEDLDVGAHLEVGGQRVAGSALVEAHDHGLFGVGLKGY